jgi:two-component system phosphate regulon sensor histidine kinase PhoR
VVTVTNTGVGIAPDQQERIFDAFEQQEGQSSRRYGGTGLGLAIVKHVLLNHDGELEIRSEIGNGSEFICHFPRDRMAEAEPEPEKPSLPETGTDR